MFGVVVFTGFLAEKLMVSHVKQHFNVWVVIDVSTYKLAGDNAITLCDEHAKITS